MSFNGAWLPGRNIVSPQWGEEVVGGLDRHPGGVREAEVGGDAVHVAVPAVAFGDADSAGRAAGQGYEVGGEKVDVRAEKSDDGGQDGRVGEEWEEDAVEVEASAEAVLAVPSSVAALSDVAGP
ncbi:hypothetical protein [Streptomyces sp. NPDC088727]|uniref:hypothetical protein n=1 Tax=Streptomyces sp. NPDC088727 TaxID=3365875 RepID=UPI0037FB6E7B